MKTKQHGLSLISIIVGIAVASAFLLLITKIYANSVNSERFQATRSALQDQGRFLMSDIRRIVSVAGLDISNADVSIFNTDGLQIASTTSNTDDHIVVAYQRTGGCRGSLGSVETENEIHNTELFLNNRNLMCRDNTGSNRNVGDAVAIANGIYAFRVLYGIDTNDDGFPNRYVQDTDLGSATQSEIVKKIRAIRVGVLVSSGDFLLANTDKQTQSQYNVLGSPVNIDLNTDDNDRKLFSVYETTIYLRNMSNSVLRFKPQL